MKTIEKLSEVEDKLLDPRELSYRLKAQLRRRLGDLLKTKKGKKGKKGEEEKDAEDVDLKQQLKELLAREEENKQLLDYDTLTEIHKRMQRLDPSYTMFFFQFLDECKAIIPESKKV